MTTNHATSRWGQVGAISAIVIATLLGAAATATTADAKPRGGIEDFNQCVADAVNYRQAHGFDINMDEIKGGCCGAIGGEVVTEPDGTTFKDCVFDVQNAPGQSSPSPTPPQPGATVMLPPGLNTRAGAQ
jgi:hypothetical protein